MLSWLLVRSEHRNILSPALTRAWRGGAAMVAELALGGRKPAHAVTLIWPDGAVARRAARWPDVLIDWREIYSDALFPSDDLPVLAEEASGLGADVLIAHAELGLKEASIGWYAKGALSEYEHVGSATVAWTPEEGLGRPFDGSARSIAALGGKKLAEIVGGDRDVDLMQRIQDTNQAVGEVLVSRAFLRILGVEPPPIDELAGLVARAPLSRVRL